MAQGCEWISCPNQELLCGAWLEDTSFRCWSSEGYRAHLRPGRVERSRVVYDEVEIGCRKNRAWNKELLEYWYSFLGMGWEEEQTFEKKGNESGCCWRWLCAGETAPAGRGWLVKRCRSGFERFQCSHLNRLKWSQVGNLKVKVNNFVEKHFFLFHEPSKLTIIFHQRWNKMCYLV